MASSTQKLRQPLEAQGPYRPGNLTACLSEEKVDEPRRPRVLVDFPSLPSSGFKRRDPAPL